MHWDGSEAALASPESGHIVVDKKVILFVGKPRVGKSSIINAILQREHAKSGPGLRSVTFTANTHWTRDYVLVDTPGLFATDLKMEDYVDAVSKIRHLGVLHAVVLVVNNHFLSDDQVAADWFKFALCSPFCVAPTTIVVNQIPADDDEELKEAVERMRAQTPGFNLFGIRSCPSQNPTKVMKAIKDDARRMFSQISCQPSLFIKNILGTEMEMRSFALAKHWLCQESEQIAETVRRIENESSWLLAMCDRGAEGLRKIVETLPAALIKKPLKLLLTAGAWGLVRVADLFRELGVPKSLETWDKLVNTKKLDLDAPEVLVS